MVEYSLSFVFRLFIRFLMYLISESLVIVAVLTSLQIDVTTYCNNETLIMLQTDPLSNPLTSIAFLNIFLIFFNAYDLITERYVLKDDS